MDIRYLRSFYTVARCLNFTEAAKQLYIAQPVLSRQIALLEDQLGVKLFVRNNRFVQLTPAGDTLFKQTGPLLTRIEDIIEATRQAHAGTCGQLKLGCFGVESDFLPQILGRFRAAYPRINVSLEQVTGRMLTTGLYNGDFDIAFNGYLGNEPIKSQFMQREVRKSRICFLLPFNHSLAKRESLTFADLSQETFILLVREDCPQGYDWVLNQCELEGFKPKITTKANRMETIYWEVEAGIGVSLTVRDPVIERTLSSRISLVDMAGDDAYGSLIVTWKKDNINSAVPLFIAEFDNLPNPS